MARNRPRTTQQLIAGQQLRRFADFTDQHRRWQQLLQSCFLKLQLEPLLEHCEVLNIRAHNLILQVSSGAIAQRIKTHQARIITHFQPEATVELERLEIRIRPAHKPATLRTATASAEPATERVREEQDAVSRLREQAALCDEPLRTQLLALAQKYEDN
ncbi:DciA family protein [Pseudidiomarina sp.]|uniref:DciA family protein n=1 Tax=Pseudidiomarina sp. TaxID=2081707 RepID=UPI00299CF765|nr:DciA family protein [Pseudidiomarina sp.]MDX1705240.1 DciA family protein [Pseudidiomarina sp.]